MASENMHFGIHGNYHLWWNHLPIKKVEKEIISSKKFFQKKILNSKTISLCYPYGSFNKKIINLIKKKKYITYALSTQVGSIGKNNITKAKLNYPRFDANDFK